MKAAEEIYMQVQDAECPNANNLTLPEDWQLNAMKKYAIYVAEDLRERIIKEAFDDPYNIRRHASSIRTIEINLP